MSNTHSLRYAVIGAAASVFKGMHRPAQIAEGIHVIAACDINAQAGKLQADEIGCAFYADYRAMLAEHKPDVAVIVTPHPLHPSMTIDCLRAGCHVLLEKPMAVDVASADEMIATAEKEARVLAINFQHRFRPAIEHARALIAEDALGPLVRTLSVEPWYRTEHYYRTASWRAKWTTEGGGVLMNQAPHTLDLLCYLAGLPSKVWGLTRTRYHAIQVEDTAQAMFEYPNGAPGYLTVSTVEVGVKPRLQIIGEKGALELEGNRLTVYRTTPSSREHMLTSDAMFGKPETTSETFDLEPGLGHQAVYRDLEAAIREKRSPRADGRAGILSLELANAITLSSYSNAPVTLPVNRAAYSALLADLQAGRVK
ncbi:MAG: Gfo/Idh/MocA family oxidoreductase [Chloroflexi bacterium]|nr:Gfo/Idh/MocA family oxidoreductase [Chloroflexota bacterium]